MQANIITAKATKGYANVHLNSSFVYLRDQSTDLSNSFSILTAYASSLSNTGLYKGLTCSDVSLKLLSVSSFLLIISSLFSGLVHTFIML